MGWFGQSHIASMWQTKAFYLSLTAKATNNFLWNWIFCIGLGPFPYFPLSSDLEVNHPFFSPLKYLTFFATFLCFYSTSPSPFESNRFGQLLAHMLASWDKMRKQDFSRVKINKLCLWPSKEYWLFWCLIILNTNYSDADFSGSSYEISPCLDLQ